jgi:uncharacterized membrane protein HdeD (DUF308 family)
MGTGMEKWWSYFLRGILALLFGIILLVWPTATLYVVIILFGIYALVEGLFAIGYSIARASRGDKFFALLMLGIIGVLVGAIVLARPGVSSLALVWVIAFWALLRGIMFIVSAFEMTGSAGARWLIGLVGVLAIIVGILLFAHPVAGIWTISLVIGIYALLAGIILIITSFPVRSLQKKEAAAA